MIDSLGRMLIRASDAGRSWAQSLRDDLALEGRRAAGGWPGTVSEARARTARLMEGSLFGKSPELREQVARALYAAARGGWLEWRERDDSDPIVLDDAS